MNKLNTLDRLRRAGCSDEEARAIADALKESEKELRQCSCLCSDCPKINTCCN